MIFHIKEARKSIISSWRPSIHNHVFIHGNDACETYAACALQGRKYKNGEKKILQKLQTVQLP